MAWEIFNHVRPRGKRMPPNTVSVHANGMLYVAAIHADLGKYVEIDYHTDGLLRLRPISEKTADSFNVVKTRSQNSWIISLISFIAHYNLEYIKRNRYRVTRKDDMFIIDLNNPIGEVRW